MKLSWTPYTQETKISPMSIDVAFLLHPNVTQLDLTGPGEVLGRLPGARLRRRKRREPVRSDSGLMLLPTATFADVPAADVLCVPGGGDRLS